MLVSCRSVMSEAPNHLVVGNLSFKQGQDGKFHFYVKKGEEASLKFEVKTKFLKAAFERKKSNALIQALILKMLPSSDAENSSIETAIRGLKILQIVAQHSRKDMVNFVLDNFNLSYNMQGQKCLDVLKARLIGASKKDKNDLEEIIALIETKWGIKGLAIGGEEKKIWFEKITQLEGKIEYLREKNCNKAASGLEDLVEKLKYMELPYRKMPIAEKAMNLQAFKDKSLEAINMLYDNEEAMIEIHTFKSGILKLIATIVSYVTDIVKNRNSFFVPQTETSKMLSELEELQKKDNSP